jgi:hypothetical protein
VGRAAARFRQKEDRQPSGVISSGQSHTHVLDSPRVWHVLKESTFSFRELVAGQSTCYLILALLPNAAPLPAGGCGKRRQVYRQCELLPAPCIARRRTPSDL